MDTASLSFFMQCGVPPWRASFVKTRGIVEHAALLEINTAQFIKVGHLWRDARRHDAASRNGAPR